MFYIKMLNLVSAIDISYYVCIISLDFKNWEEEHEKFFCRNFLRRRRRLLST